MEAPSSGSDFDAVPLNGGGRTPVVQLPSWLYGKASPLELAVLGALQLHFPNIRPSLQRLADKAGMHRATVLKVLADLERKGWVLRTSRTTKEGRSLPNSYELRIFPTDEQIERALGADQEPLPTQKDRGSATTTVRVAHNDPPRVAENDPRKQRGLRVAENDPGGSPTTTLEGRRKRHEVHQEQEEQEQEETALEGQAIASDGPAKGQAIADGDRDQGSSGSKPAKGPAGTNPRARGENPRASSRAFAPSEADIPASLLPVQTELIGFWKHKGGKRNAVAWSFLLGQLEQIQGHIEGGTDVVRCQLTRGIAVVQAGGKPWTSVTFDNWHRYGRTTGNNQARGRPIPGRTPEGLTLTEAFRLEGLIP